MKKEPVERIIKNPGSQEVRREKARPGEGQWSVKKTGQAWECFPSPPPPCRQKESLQTKSNLQAKSKTKSAVPRRPPRTLPAQTVWDFHTETMAVNLGQPRAPGKGRENEVLKGSDLTRTRDKLQRLRCLWNSRCAYRCAFFSSLERVAHR